MEARVSTRTWQLQEAKNKLSQVIDEALSDPQLITRRGKPVAYVVSAESWERGNRSSLRKALRTWFASVHDALRGNVIPFDADCALLWGRIHGRLARAGTPVPLMNSLIGITALRHDMILVTRNATHFSPLGVDVADPWT
jgi:prevent-host-death family protein